MIYLFNPIQNDAFPSLGSIAKGYIYILYYIIVINNDINVWEVVLWFFVHHQFECSVSVRFRGLPRVIQDLNSQSPLPISCTWQNFLAVTISQQFILTITYHINTISSWLYKIHFFFMGDINPSWSILSWRTDSGHPRPPMHVVKALASKSLHKWSTGSWRVTFWRISSIAWLFAGSAAGRGGEKQRKFVQRSKATGQINQLPNFPTSQHFKSIPVIKRGNGNLRSQWRFLAIRQETIQRMAFRYQVWLLEGPFIGWDAVSFGRFPEPYHHLPVSFRLWGRQHFSA